MRNKARRRIKTIIVLTILVLTFLILRSTYSKYINKSTGNYNVRLGTWSVKVNNQDITQPGTTSFNIGNFEWDTASNPYAGQGKIIPGAKGYFNIRIDPTDTDVSIKYTVQINKEEFLRKIAEGISISTDTTAGLTKKVNLQITSIQVNDVLVTPPIDDSENINLCFIKLLEDIQSEEETDRIDNLRVEVTWVDNEDNSEIDAEIGGVFGNQFSLPITVNAIQYTGGGIYATNQMIFIDNGYATIPEGFTLSGVEEEQNVEKGLVIYNITDKSRQDIESDDWFETSVANDYKNDYDQFVWVPVQDETTMYGTNSSGKRLGKLYNEDDLTTQENWTEVNGEMYVTDSSGYREPDSGITESELATVNTILETNYTTTSEFENDFNEDFELMTSSVKNYKGFYIGRYETSLADSTVLAQGSGTDARSAKNVLSVESGTNSLGWAGLYAIQKKYALNNDSVKSSMIWGSQYDQLMKWIESTGINVTTSTPPIVEVEEEVEVPENEDTNTTNSINTTKTETVIVQKQVERNASNITGNLGYYDELNNIYDLYGAHQELTLESVLTNKVQRSGSSESAQKLTYRQSSTANASSRITLYISEPRILDKVERLAELETTGLLLDDYGNLRYNSINVNNYVEFNRQGELWRIIGIFNVDGEQKIKLVRDDSIGSFSYDTSDQDSYYGYGIANWNDADIMKLLNPDYEMDPIGGSLYWNSESGYAFNARANGYIECDFSSTGLTEEARNMISKSTFNLGGMTTNAVTASASYGNERGNLTSSVVTSATWKGYVGLMYPSDWGYAMDTSYWSTNMSSYPYNYLDDYNYLFKNGISEWLITHNSNQTYQVFGVNHTNTTTFTTLNCCEPRAIRPVVYLKPEVIIEDGNGTKTNPYILSLYE